MKILFLSFLSNISVILIYIDYLPYISFLYWIVLFLFIFKKQFFLYFPVFLIVYFSILFFINTLIKESFIYNGILITPINYKDVVIVVMTCVFLIIEIIYLIYTKRKIKQKDDLYDVTLIFIKKSKIDTYQQLDTLIIDGLKKRKIDIILVDQVLVNKQSLRNVYIGVLDELDYDCLLNKELMGGIIWCGKWLDSF